MLKKNKITYISLVCIIIVLATGIFLKQYIKYVNTTRDKEVTNQLSEVYGKVNRRFNELAQRNWNLLYGGALAYSLSEDETLMRSYIYQLKVQWDFHEWLFVNDDGYYMNVQGDTGFLNLGKDFSLLTKERQNITVDGTLAGSEPVMLFAIPVEENTYNGFSFSAVALAYNKEDMKSVMEDNSYEGKSECFLLYPDGRILLSFHDGIKGNRNLFNFLKEAVFEHSSYEDIHRAIRAGEKGACRYRLDGEDNYLYYQPVGFQDWIMVGIVPQKAVGIYMEKILQQTVLLSLLSLGAVMMVLIIMVVVQYRRKMAEKTQELGYQERMFEILSSNTTNLFIVVVPGTYEVEYISSNAEQILGISAEKLQQDMELLNDLKYVEHVGREGLRWSDLEEIPIGGMNTMESVRCHAKTGKKCWFEESVYHVKIGDRERFIFLLQDRTKEKEDQENLKMALDIARAANEAKSAFLSNMSHDIRTPMNVVIGLLPLLQAHAEDPKKVREYARKINISSQHLLGLINDILDMSKIESGKTSLNLLEFRLSELIDGLAMIIRPQAHAKQQEFDIYVKGIQYETLVGDSMKISQIMVNILSNAVKYTPPGGRIEMKVEQLPQRTKHISRLRFTISDNGIGISEEYQKVIFEPFTREDKHKGEKIKGTGLGMSIVKNLVDLMGGSVSVESKLGEGSRFTVELGLRICEEETDSRFWEKHSISHTLVVDDDPDVCDNIVQTVKDSGLDMDYALSGREAVEKVRKACEEKKDFDLLLLDWKMPDMDGLETAVRIREIVSEKVPIFILSAYDWSEIEEEAREAGINGFLTKPFFLSNFKDTVEEVCQFMEADREDDAPKVHLQGMHILVAEDYELNAEILKGILEMYGATCDVCENGLETVQRFESAPEGTYDLVLMDIQMPLMDGCEAAEKIRGCAHPQAGTVPIVAMSANAFSDDVKKAMEAGMNAYLTKPVDAKLLEKTLVKIYTGE